MKYCRDLLKKKKIKTMNNKMAKNTNTSTTESNKQTKQRRRTETESWIESVLMVADGRGVWGMGEVVRGLRSTKR